MGPGIRLPIYSRWTNRYSTVQLLTRCSSSRHLLRCGPLPLRSIYGGSIRDLRRVRPLVPSIYGTHPAPHMNKVPLLGHVPRSQPNILPATLPRAGRNATTLLGLPRRIYNVKRPLLSGVHNFASLCSYLPGNSLGGLCRPATDPPASIHPYLS